LNARRGTIAPGGDLYWFLTDAPGGLDPGAQPGAVRRRRDSAVHPYRQLPADCEAPPAPSEERILHAVLCAVGAIPVVIAVLRGGGFGVEATVGLVMAVAGLVGLVASVRTGGRHAG
jgi:hypothetical protein